MNAQDFLTVNWAFGILVTFFIALLWHFIRVLEKKFDEAAHDRKDLHNEINAVKLDYATKQEANATAQNVMSALNRLEDKLDRVNEKLDKKADKS